MLCFSHHSMLLLQDFFMLLVLYIFSHSFFFFFSRLRCNNDICCWLCFHFAFIFLDDFILFFWIHTIHYYFRRFCALFLFVCVYAVSFSMYNKKNSSTSMFAFSLNFSCDSGCFFLFILSFFLFWIRCVQMCVMWAMPYTWFVVVELIQTNQRTWTEENFSRRFHHSFGFNL